MPKTRSATRIDDAVRLLRAFLLSPSFGSQQVEWRREEVWFSDGRDWGIALSGVEASRYHVALRTLFDACSSRKDVSQKALERLFNSCILDYANRQDDSRDEPSHAAAEEACARLLGALSATPKTFRVLVQICGIAPEHGEHEFGNATFISMSIDDLERFILSLSESDTSVNLVSASAGRVRWWLENENRERFSAVAIAVDAQDHDSAIVRAIDEARRMADVLNFYLRRPKSQREFIYLPGDREAGDLTTLAKCDGTHWKPSWRRVGHMNEISLQSIFGDNSLYRDYLNRANTLVKAAMAASESERKDLLAPLIVTSLQWAGRAGTSVSNEEAFLHYMVSLESLVLLDRHQRKKAETLARRIKTLLKIPESNSASLLTDLRYLYDLRSRIVHDGRYDISISDLDIVRSLARSSILTVAHDEPYIGFTYASELLEYFKKHSGKT